MYEDINQLHKTKTAVRWGRRSALRKLASKIACEGHLAAALVSHRDEAYVDAFLTLWASAVDYSRVTLGI